MDWRLVVALLALGCSVGVFVWTEYRLWRDGGIWPYRRRPGRDYWGRATK